MNLEVIACILILAAVVVMIFLAPIEVYFWLKKKYNKPKRNWWEH